MLEELKVLILLFCKDIAVRYTVLSFFLFVCFGSVSFSFLFFLLCCNNYGKGTSEVAAVVAAVAEAPAAVLRG